MKQLDAVLIGVPKSGSTTLADWLRSHPHVAMARIKEPNFYARELDPKTFGRDFLRVSPDAGPEYWNLPDPLPMRHQAYVREPQDYARLWPDASPGQLKIEASTSYFWSPSAATDVPKANPGVQAVVVLRNPVNRAFSQYRMARKYGLVRGGFLEELARDANQPVAWGQRENFVQLSRYADSLKRWRASGCTVHVFLYEEAFAVPDAFWAEVQRKLGLPFYPLPHEDRVHEAVDVRWPGLVRWAQHSLLGRTAKELIPERLLQGFRRAAVAKSALELSPEDRSLAWRYFADDVAELEGLLGKNLSLWT